MNDSCFWNSYQLKYPLSVEIILYHLVIWTSHSQTSPVFYASLHWILYISAFCMFKFYLEGNDMLNFFQLTLLRNGCLSYKIAFFSKPTKVIYFFVFVSFFCFLIFGLWVMIYFNRFLPYLTYYNSLLLLFD